MSDEFGDAATMSSWLNRSTVENSTRQYTVLDINTTTPGSLVIIPTQSAWYTNNVAPFLYQNVTGNFVISTRVNARNTSNPNSAPTSLFNSAGIVVRNPASAGLPSNQNWVQYDIGNQQTFVGIEAENTVSSTQMNAVRLSTNGVFTAVLRVCRIGGVFYTFNSVDAEQTWTQGQTYTRNDFPQTLQVGLGTNAYSTPVNIRAEFDFARFAVPVTLADCTASMPGGPPPPPPPPPPPNNPPTVTITSPSDGTSVLAGQSVVISASASDSDGTITGVAFYQGATLLGTVSASPYSIGWSSTVPGTYALTAIATDNSAASTTSGAVNVTVTPGPPPPPPPPPPDLSTLGDEFNDPATLSKWTVAFPTYTTLDVNASTPGRLTIIPSQFAGNSWYSDNQSPFVFKTVTGDFVVETDENVGRRTDVTLAPRGQFNAAGLVVRDPASASPGHQNWVMYNMGFEVTSVAREIKTTRTNVAGGASLSTLYVTNTPAAAHAGKIRICRLGGTFHFFHRHPSEAAWVEEAIDPTTQRYGNGAGEATPGVNGAAVGTIVQFIRSDLPQTLQVGVMAGVWSSPFDTRADYDYIRFALPASLTDCTADIPPAP